MSEDIILSMPWKGSSWHMANYWAYSDGSYTVDNYSDGDHEDIDEDDIPSEEECRAAFRDYSEFVAETGDDPLGEYFVDRTRTVTETWQARFATWIGVSQYGLRCIGIRRGDRGEWQQVIEAPGYVREYLCLSKNCCLEDAKTVDELLSLVGVTKGTRGRSKAHATITFKVEREVENKNYHRQLRRLAREHLKQGA